MNPYVSSINVWTILRPLIDVRINFERKDWKGAGKNWEVSLIF